MEKTVTPAEKTAPTRTEELSAEIRVEKDDIVVGGQNQPGFKDDEDDNMVSEGREWKGAWTEEENFLQVANEGNRAATPIAIDPIENNEDEEIQAIAIVKQLVHWFFIEHVIRMPPLQSLLDDEENIRRLRDFECASQFLNILETKNEQ